MPSARPRGPRHTCSISAGPGRHVATTSARVATSAGDEAHRAPAARRFRAASGRASWTISSRPAARSWAAMGSPMCPTPTKPIRMSARLQRVQAARVVPEDLALAPVAERQRQEAVHGPRVLRVAVWIVGRGDQVVVADDVDHVADELLVAFDRAEALTAEVLRWAHRQMGHLAIRLTPLMVLVHPGEPEGQPAALALEKREAQPRKPLHDAAHDYVHAGEHLLHGVRGDVGDAERLEAVGAGGAHARSGRLVKADGDVELLTRRPEGVVVGGVPRTAVVDVRTQEDRLHAEFGDGAPHFRHRARYVVGRHG